MEVSGVTAEPAQGVIRSTEVAKNVPSNKKHRPKRHRRKAQPVEETAEEQARWAHELSRSAPIMDLPTSDLLDAASRAKLEIFRTPGCRSLQLTTARLRLRQCEPEDLEGIRKIKMEPLVQKTQLYGSPTAEECRDNFLNRYIRSSIPHANVSFGGKKRDEYIFAITLLDPSSVPLNPHSQILPSNRLMSSDGYVGNIALVLDPESPQYLCTKQGKRYYHPSFELATEARLKASMFYELHPQLWGNGLMSEAFKEVLRFAIEEVGCVSVQCNPATSNPASIRLCLNNGLRHTHTSKDLFYGKSQAFHEITRQGWWTKHRPGEPITDKLKGKEVCRWCMNFCLSVPAYVCSGCTWARYCSRECQRADWVRRGGHRSACGN